MDRQDAEKTITEYLKPVFGFALKRCKNMHDAEDLAQEVITRAFCALLVREDIVDMGKFIWTIAHNALSNYYRDTARYVVGIPSEEAAKLVADPSEMIDFEDNAESIRRLQYGIAYLSKLQRKVIIAYYFENRKQAEIARTLGIPLGTVKWHLFEAKKELKRGMGKMRKAGELKFNPIKFHSYGTAGNIGTKEPGEFFRSALSQNICYSVRNTAKSVNEIADDLGISPVYVEDEAEYLEEYGFLQAEKEKYRINFIIHEPTEKLLAIQNDMYQHAAGLFANDLYDGLMASGILDDPDVQCWQNSGPVTLEDSRKADDNFLLWALIPYLAACSGEASAGRGISFEEVATIRPDGAQNIFHAAVMPDGMVLPDGYVYQEDWCGPMWNGNGRHILWQVGSRWSGREEFRTTSYAEDARRVLSLYEREAKERLSKDEYAWLAERGYVKTNGDYDGQFKAEWQIVILRTKEIQARLLSIGGKIKEKYKGEFEAAKKPYAKAVLESVPAHLKKVKEYELQYVFDSDMYFLLHCIETLLGNGKLKEPAKGQEKALATLIIPA